MLTASVSSATSVNLRWLAAAPTVGPVTGLGTNSIVLAPSATATLTLDIRIAVDGGGLSSAFLSLEFDRDLQDELNILSFAELTWTGAMMSPSGLPKLEPFALGVATQESTGTQMGKLYTFDVTTISTASDCCPVNTTIAFGRVVFTTNHLGFPLDDIDIFSGLFNVGIDGMFNQAGVSIGHTTAFGTARIHQIPEPGAACLLGLGLACMAAACRRQAASAGRRG
jgi:hypothetical protein